MGYKKKKLPALMLAITIMLSSVMTIGASAAFDDELYFNEAEEVEINYPLLSGENDVYYSPESAEDDASLFPENVENDYIESDSWEDIDNAFDAEAEEELSGIIVTFLGNGAGAIIEPGQDVRRVELYSSLGSAMPTMIPQRGGFAFRHWNTVADDIGLDNVFTANTIITSEMLTDDSLNVYAQWGHLVSFNPNISDAELGVPIIIPPRIVPPGMSVDLTDGIYWPPNPVRPGFIFGGWFDDGTEFTGASTINDNINLVAHWEADDTYTVIFSPGGGAIAAGHQDTRQARSGLSISDSWLPPHNLNHGILWPRSAPHATRTNTNTPNNSVGNPSNYLTLGGWNTAPYGGGTQFATTGGDTPPSFATAPVNSSMVDSDGNMTVYARWAYRVVFDNNGGGRFVGPNIIGGENGSQAFRDINVTSQTITGGTIADNGTAVNTRVLPTITRDGHEFLGWWNLPIPINTDDADLPTGALELTAGSFINASGTVWARWRSNDNVTVTFELDGGHWAATGEIGIRTIPQNSTITDATGVNMPVQPLRGSYVFMGWYPMGQVGIGTRFAHNTPVSEDITVYARWLPAFTVTLNPNGGTTIRPTAPLVQPGATSEPYSLPIAANHTFNQMDALWRATGPINWSFSFGVRLNPNTNRVNYTFHGWNTAADGTGTPFDANTIVTQDENIFAMWAPAITFNNNHTSAGGAVDSTTTRNVLLGRSINNHHLHPNATNIPLTLPSTANWNQLARTGYSFIGWNTQPDSNGQWFDQNTVIALDQPPLTVYAVWSAGVGFNPGAGPWDSILPENRSRYIDFPGQLGSNMPPNPVWPGHNFRNWNTQPDGSGVALGAGDTIDSPVTLYALWSANLTFDLNGGQTIIGGDLTNSTAAVNIGEPIGAVFPVGAEREGHTFVGWNTASDRSGTNFTALTPVQNSATLYAQWDSTVTFNYNFAGGPTSVQRTTRSGATFGEAQMPYIPDRDYYSFAGWFEGPLDAGGNPIGAELTADTEVNGHAEVFARWVPRTLTVIFEPEGGAFVGETPPVTRQVLYGDSIGAENMPVVELAAWEFGGWWTQPNGGGTQFWPTTNLASAIVDSDGSVTVYALWSRATHAVTFNHNFVGASAPETRSVLNYDTLGADMPATATRPAAWNFLGWNTAEDGSGEAFGSGTPVTQSLTIWAQWDTTVTFHGNGGTPATYQVPNVRAGTLFVDLTPPVITRTNWNHAGWWLEQFGGSQTAGTTPVTSVSQGGANIYARWTADIRFYLNDGSGQTHATANVFDGDNLGTGAWSASDPQRENYEFGGWRKGPLRPDGNPTGDTVDALSTFPGGHTDVYAVWSPAMHTVTFNANGGSLVNAPAGTTIPSSIQVQQGSVANGTPPNNAFPVAIPYRANYVFDGWYTTAPATIGGLPGGTAFTAATIVSEPMTLYARWLHISDPANNAIVFHLNIPNETHEPVSIAGNLGYPLVDSGSDLTQIPSTSGRGPRTFVGWSTVPNDTIPPLQYGVAFDPAGTLVGAQPIHFYAQWRVDLTFVPSGNVSEMANFPADTYLREGTAHSTLPMPGSANVPTWPGRTFRGWNTAPDRSGTNITGETVVIGDMTLYAQWDAGVTFMMNDSTATQHAQRTVMNATVLGTDMPGDPSRGGFAFTGWATAPGGSPTFTENTTINGNTTVYAQWEGTITFNLAGGNIADNTEPLTRTVPPGGSLGPEMPEGPVRFGATFAGWQLADGTAFTASTSVYGHTTVYARWTSTVTFNLAGGSIDGATSGVNRTVSTGDALGANMPPDPIRLDAAGNYAFLGWATAPGGMPTFTANTPVTQHLTVYAVWATPVPEVVIGGGGGNYPISFPNYPGPNHPAPENVVISTGSDGRVGITISPPPGNFFFPGSVEIIEIPPGYIILEGPTLNSDGTLSVVIITPRVIFNLNGGNVVGNPRNVIHPIPYGYVIGPGNVPQPRNPGHLFLGWWQYGIGQILTASQVEELTLTSPLMEFVAIWTPIGSVTGNPGGGTGSGGVSAGGPGLIAESAGKDLTYAEDHPLHLIFNQGSTLNPPMGGPTRSTV